MALNEYEEFWKSLAKSSRPSREVLCSGLGSHLLSSISGSPGQKLWTKPELVNAMKNYGKKLVFFAARKATAFREAKKTRMCARRRKERRRRTRRIVQLSSNQRPVSGSPDQKLWTKPELVNAMKDYGKKLVFFAARKATAFREAKKTRMCARRRKERRRRTRRIVQLSSKQRPVSTTDGRGDHTDTHAHADTPRHVYTWTYI